MHEVMARAGRAEVAEEEGEFTPLTLGLAWTGAKLPRSLAANDGNWI
jgi:hypothetical protein